LARLAQLQGTVKLELEIGNDGKVLSVRASGAHPLLLREAESNVRQWLFSAPSLGASNKLRHTVEFVYRIEGKELYHDPQPRIELFLPDKAVLTTNPSEPQP
jgi:outer membrane biosynthesis protein TonB